MLDSGQPEQQHETPNFLLGLPGPALASLWLKLPAQDRLSLFRVCRGFRDFVLTSCSDVNFQLSSPRPAPLLRTLLSRPQPLKRLGLKAGKLKDEGVDQGLQPILHEVAAALVAAAAGGGPWHGAASLQELALECMRITAEAAALLPQAFPHLQSLSLHSCALDETAALLTALRSCKYLSHVTLVGLIHEKPEGLWAAAVSEAEASEGDLALLQATARGYAGTGTDDRQPHQQAKGRAAAATAYLLAHHVPHLASMKLGLPWVLAVFRPMVQVKGLGSRLHSVSLLEMEHVSYFQVTPALNLLTAALETCSSLTSLELNVGFGEGLASALEACPSRASLRKLSIPRERVDGEMLDAILQGMPALEHLRVREFQNLKQFRAKAPCRWRSLEITSGALDVRTLAHLPLHSLTEPIDMGTEVMFTCERSATCAQAAALVQAAQANLARYEPRTCAGPALKELTVRAEVHCPSMLHLLAFFPGSSYFHLCMPKLGEEEVACLAQTGGFARGTAKLVVGANTKLGSTFFSPSLWAAMPGLQTLRIYGKDALGVSLFKAAEGLAAVPRPVRVQFPNLAGLGWVQELHALVQTMAEGRGIVVEEY